MRVSNKNLSTIHSVLVPVCMVLALLAIPSVASAAAPCNQSNTVGGGALGLSPGPVGPPNSLGWDVGSVQCNGSFNLVNDGAFPGGAIQIALRAEERRVGPVAKSPGGQYLVQLGNDTNAPPTLTRAWWNFQASIAYGGDIDDLDSLTLTIQTLSGPNVPALPSFDLLALRTVPDIDDRNNQPNATTSYADLYQISQNPEFGWFDPATDTDANPNGNFDYDEEGAWIFTITATEGTSSASTSICIHTPGASCPPAQVPASSPWSIALLGVLFAGTLGFLAVRRWTLLA